MSGATMRPADADRLEAMVRADARLMQILHAARDIDPPHWYLGAGALRNTVWDRLHDYTEQTLMADIDLIYFDGDDLDPACDGAWGRALGERLPAASWEVANQAAVHLWYEEPTGEPLPPLTSSEDGIATWPETATCVGVRLNADDTLQIVAPYGLDDLFQLIVRHNPRRASVAQFRQRITNKGWLARWPKLTVVDPD